MEHESSRTRGSSSLDTSFATWSHIFTTGSLSVVIGGYNAPTGWDTEDISLRRHVIESGRDPIMIESMMALARDVAYIQHVLTDTSAETVQEYGPLDTRLDLLSAENIEREGWWMDPFRSPLGMRWLMVTTSSPMLTEVVTYLRDRPMVAFSMALPRGEPVPQEHVPEPCLVVAPSLTRLFALYCVLCRVMDPDRIGVLYDSASHAEMVASFRSTLSMPHGFIAPERQRNVLLIPTGINLSTYDLQFASGIPVLETGIDPGWMVDLIDHVRPCGSSDPLVVHYFHSKDWSFTDQRILREIEYVRRERTSRPTMTTFGHPSYGYSLRSGRSDRAS